MSNGPYLELEGESDRASAILSAAFLDHELGVLLRRFLRNSKVSDELFSGTNPLATFSSRIKLAYCLNLIDDRVFRDLDLIRRIRNDFAHLREPKRFTDQDVANRCRELTLPKIARDPADPRERFETAVKVALGAISAYQTLAHAEKRGDTSDVKLNTQEYDARQLLMSTWFDQSKKQAGLSITFAERTPLRVVWSDRGPVEDLAREFGLLAGFFAESDPDVDRE